MVETTLNSKVNIYQGYSIEIKDESVLGGKAVYINVGNKNSLQIENLYTVVYQNKLICSR